MRQLATIQQIAEIKPIEGADRIVMARINGWWVVTAKDNNFEVGQDVCYLEIDSFLPNIPPFEFLKKGSSLRKLMVDGVEREGIRLKTIRLRGQISQGLIMPLAELTNYSKEPLSEKTTGDDITEALGVYKWEPPIPAQLVGKVKGSFPGFLRKTDEERIQNMPDVLSGFYVTEKLDGSSVTFYKKDGVFGVCSRNLDLLETEGNTQWRIARELGLAEKLPDNFAIQGELVGEGIQGNPYKIKGQKVYFFNAYNVVSGTYLNFEDFKQFFAGIGLQTVPILNEHFALPETVDDLLILANGQSALDGSVLREGIVVRPKIEMNYKGSRLSFKAISNQYLLKNES